MFHLDEYLELPETHKASFRRYLKERFTSKVPVKVHFVNTEGDVEENLKELTREIRKDIIDIALLVLVKTAISHLMTRRLILRHRKHTESWLWKNAAGNSS